MIEDKELLDLFKIESSEHIQRLDEGFLRLEKEPANAALLADAMREAHSLKGAARMLGLSDIEKLSHELEDMLNAAKKGEAALTPDAIDGMYKTLDEIKKFVREAITGEAPQEESGMRGAESKPSASGAELDTVSSGIKAESEIQEPEAGSEIKEEPSQIPQSPALTKGGEGGILHLSEFKIETIRVETKKLDSLMTHLGELGVTKLRISRRPAEIEEIHEQILDLGLRIEDLKSEIQIPKSEIVSPAVEEQSKIQNLKAKFDEIGSKIQSLKSKMGDDSSRLEFISNEMEDRVRAIRLLPFSTIFNLFPRMVRDLARQKSKEANLIIEGADTKADKRIIEEIKDPLMHIIRNSIDHGIELPSERERKAKSRVGMILLKAYQTAANVIIEVKDDGKGIDLGAIRQAAIKKKICREDELAAMSPSQIQSLIFSSGLSTSSFVTDVSGRGIGLDVVRANVEHLKGTVQIESTPDSGCTIKMQLPITLATARVLIAGVNGRSYAIPVEHVLTNIFVSRRDIFTIEGRETVAFEGQPVSIARLSDLLEVQDSEFGVQSEKTKSVRDLKLLTPDPKLISPCVIISVGGDRFGILVGELLDEQEIVLKPYSMLLKRVRNVSGTTILGTGEVCIVLNPYDLVKSLRKRDAPAAVIKAALEEEKKKSVLIAEDSLTTRIQIKRILEGAGYDVEAAVDGLDAFGKLSARQFDAIVTDISMPNMDGLTLTAKVRQEKKYKELPIILVSYLASDEDKQRGLEAGANAYITKPAFDQKVFLDMLKRLI